MTSRDGCLMFRVGKVGFIWKGPLDKLAHIFAGQAEWRGPGPRRLFFYGVSVGHKAIGVINSVRT